MAMLLVMFMCMFLVAFMFLVEDGGRGVQVRVLVVLGGRALPVGSLEGERGFETLLVALQVVANGRFQPEWTSLVMRFSVWRESASLMNGEIEIHAFVAAAGWR